MIVGNMAKFRRPDAQPRGSAADPGVGAYSDPAGLAGFAGRAGDVSPTSMPAGPVRGGSAPPGAAPGAVALPALPADAEVPEHVRKRERKLVEAACRGETSAVDALYRTHYDTIYRYVALRLGSPAVAEDVTSQIFLGMIRGLARYRDEGKPFIAWLYGIAQKQIAFFQRGQGRQPPSLNLDAAAELITDTLGPHATAERRELRLRVAKALSEMPDGQREVITLRYVLALSLAETAAAVERTEGAVKQLQLRGLATLKSLLGSRGGELL